MHPGTLKTQTSKDSGEQQTAVSTLSQSYTIQSQFLLVITSANTHLCADIIITIHV